MAQRKRAGPITQRSEDQNLALLEIFLQISFFSPVLDTKTKQKIQFARERLPSMNVLLLQKYIKTELSDTNLKQHFLGTTDNLSTKVIYLVCTVSGLKQIPV